MPRLTKTPRARSRVNPASDEQLMALAKRGDLSAFETIVNRHKQDVYNLAFSILRHREDAEEAAQDTFLKLFRRRDLFDESRNLSPWLLRIAGNTCRDKLRRRTTKRLPMVGDADEHLVFEVEDPRPAQDAHAATDQLVRHELEQLSERHRLPLEMKYLHEYTNQQIAEALGISVSNVKVRVARAKDVLQSRLDRVLSPD